MTNTTLAFTLPTILFAVGCAVTEPASGSEPADPDTSQVTSLDTAAAQLCGVFQTPTACAQQPRVLSIASNAPSKLAYTTAGWSSCTMTYVLPNGFTDSFPFPTDASGTPDAGAGVRYTLRCTVSIAGLDFFSSSANTLVF
ncbi:MAG TPA: hypothetical protein VGD80_32740 [Kofleriaceae bacterium]